MIVKLEMNDYQQRASMVTALAMSGYDVHIEVVSVLKGLDVVYFVVFNTVRPTPLEGPTVQ